MINIEELINDEVETYNESIGHLKYYDCDLCKNRGYIAKKIYVGNMPYKVLTECSCMSKRNALKEKQNSKLSEILLYNTFDNYKTKEKWQSNIKKLALNFVSDDKIKFFYIGGNVGVGKTHICLAIINELFDKNKKCKMFFWNDITTLIKQNKFNQENYDRIMGEIINAEILFIDDFLKITPDKDDFDIAFKIINARYNLSQMRNIKTIISSEYGFMRLLNLDEALASRIYQYCDKGSYFVSIESNEIKNQRF